MVVLLDSSTVVGFLDRDDALHADADRRLRALAGRERLIVSVVSYAEVLTGARLGHHDIDTVQGFFAQLIDDIVVVDVEVAERASVLRAAKRSLRMPDALILATADVRQADVVLAGDEGWGDVPIGPEVEVLRERVA